MSKNQKKIYKLLKQIQNLSKLTNYTNNNEVRKQSEDKIDGYDNEVNNEEIPFSK